MVRRERGRAEGLREGGAFYIVGVAHRSGREDCCVGVVRSVVEIHRFGLGLSLLSCKLKIPLPNFLF